MTFLFCAFLSSCPRHQNWPSGTRKVYWMNWNGVLSVSGNATEGLDSCSSAWMSDCPLLVHFITPRRSAAPINGWPMPGIGLAVISAACVGVKAEDGAFVKPDYSLHPVWKQRRHGARRTSVNTLAGDHPSPAHHRHTNCVLLDKSAHETMSLSFLKKTKKEKLYLMICKWPHGSNVCISLHIY